MSHRLSHPFLSSYTIYLDSLANAKVHIQHVNSYKFQSISQSNGVYDIVHNLNWLPVKPLCVIHPQNLHGVTSLTIHNPIHKTKTHIGWSLPTFQVVYTTRSNLYPFVPGVLLIAYSTRLVLPLAPVLLHAGFFHFPSN